MNHDTYTDSYLRDVLSGVRTIAVVGASPRPHRPSHGVMRYLQRQGYRAIPVNPFAAGTTILGEICYAALADIPLADIGPIDMVDIFRALWRGRVGLRRMAASMAKASMTSETAGDSRARTGLVVVEAEFVFGRLEAVLDGPAPSFDRHQHCHRGAGGAPGGEKGQGAISDIAADQKAPGPQTGQVSLYSAASRSASSR